MSRIMVGQLLGMDATGHGAPRHLRDALKLDAVVIDDEKRDGATLAKVHDDDGMVKGTRLHL